MFQKLKGYIVAHKILASLAGIVIVVGGYFVFFRGTSVAATQYALAQVTRGTIVTSVSGTGQVSASNQIDIKSKASGNIVYVNAALLGKTVKSGTLIAEVDPTAGTKAVRDAQLSLQSAQIDLQKLQTSQTSNRPKLQQDIDNATTALVKNYQDGFNGVSTAFTGLPNALGTVYDVLYGDALNGACKPDFCEYENLVNDTGRMNFQTMVMRSQNDFKAASASYDASFEDYKDTDRTSADDTISGLIDETLNTTQLLSQAIKSEQTMLTTLVANINGQSEHAAVPAAVTTYQSDLDATANTVNGYVSSLLSIQSSITSGKQTIEADQQNLSDATQNDPLDLATQQNTLAQRQAAVTDAQTALGDYYIRAPFDGVIAANTFQKGLDASAGSATIITNQKIVEISVNEVDVAKIALGQQATLTFSAIPDLTLTGKVASIDTVGTVTQGVVSYNAKVAFDTDDSRVKPGMSVSAAIITQVKQDVLEVPTAAVKTQGGQSYVQTVTGAPATSGTVAAALLANAPQSVPVTVGLQGDTMTEIVDGLSEGDTIVTRTIAASAAAATTTTRTSTTGLQGLGGGNATFGGATSGAVRKLGQ